MINIQNLKKNFPIFQNNPDLTYLDSTATTLKPLSVIRKMDEYYGQYSANIFRGI
ncbi:cysteine desulfurase, partial [Candidatus Roizmanbacteria bacterium CG_4_10_14_0_8_um_filter_39_9]